MLTYLKIEVLKFCVNLYQLVPLSGITKAKVKFFIFSHFGFLCKSIPAYAQFKQVYSNVNENQLKERAKAEAKHGKTNILMVSAVLPMPDKDAGSINTQYIIKIMLDLGYSVSFFPLYFRVYVPGYTENLQKIGVNVIDNSHVRNLAEYLKDQGKNYTSIHLFRYDVANDSLKIIKKYAPDCRIVFHNMELAYLREKRQAAVEKSLMMLLKSLRTKRIESKIIEMSNYTVVHTQFERAKILNELRAGSPAKVRVFPYVYECERGRPFEEREGIMFIGNYIHPPNYDAAVFLLKDILPKIREKHLDIKCYIVGSNPPEEFFNLKDKDTIITGFVEDAKEYFRNVRLTVAPLRFSSSVRGKIVASLSHGTPCVTTTIGAEGMGFTNERDILIADNPDIFAQCVIGLYRDYGLWHKISDNGKSFIEENYSYSSGKQIIAGLMNEIINSSQVS